MAITVTHRDQISTGSNAASYATTGGITPGANKLLIAAVDWAQSGAPDLPTVSGYGLTWEHIVDLEWDTAGTRLRMGIWAALTGATPSAGDLTVDFGAVTHVGCEALVDEVDGADLSGGTAASAILQAVTGPVDAAAATSGLINLAALASADSAAYGFFAHEINANESSPGSGFTLIDQRQHNGPAVNVVSEYAINDTSVDASWTTSATWSGIAIEIAAPSSGQTVIAHRAVETDTAQPISHARTFHLGQAPETDSAQAITPRRTLAIGQAAETDTAQPITASTAGGQTIPVGQAVETDTAQAIGHAKTVHVGQAAETDSAQAVGHAKTVHVGQAAETDTAQAVTPLQPQVIVIGQAVETDTAQAIGHAKTVHLGQAIETNGAQPVTLVKTVHVGQATETDSAQPVIASTGGAIVVVVGQAVETDSARVITPRQPQVVVIGEAEELEQALPIEASTSRVVEGFVTWRYNENARRGARPRFQPRYHP